MFNGGNALTKYSIYMDDGLGGTVVLLANTADATVLTYAATSLIMGRTYVFKISAWNQVGESPLSSPVSILAATVPDAPALPITSSQSSSSITFTWLEPANNGSNVDDYKVLFCIGSNPSCTFSTLQSSTSGQKTSTLGSLIKGNYYQFKVQAHNVIGFSASSPVLLVVAADPPSQPNTPTLDAANTSASQISVHWVAPSDNGGSAITSYTLYWKLSTSGIYTNSYPTTDVVTLTHIITGLTAGAYYDIKV